MIVTPVRPRRRWSPVEVLAVVLTQAVGCCVGVVAGIMALVLLPPQGFFGVENTPSERLSGLLAAVVAAAALPAGLWLAAAIRRSRRIATAGAVVSAVVVVLALATLTAS